MLPIAQHNKLTHDIGHALDVVLVPVIEAPAALPLVVQQLAAVVSPFIVGVKFPGQPDGILPADHEGIRLRLILKSDPEFFYGHRNVTMLQSVTTLFFKHLCYSRGNSRGGSSSKKSKIRGRIRFSGQILSFTDYRFACNICNKFYYHVTKVKSVNDLSLLQPRQNRPRLLHFCNKLLHSVTKFVTKHCNEAGSGFQRFVTTFCHFLQVCQKTYTNTFFTSQIKFL